MIDDELLKAAAAEVRLCQLNALSEQEMEPHVFSKKFEKKMKHLIYKTDHPYRRTLRNIAAIFIAAVMLFATFLSINPKARAAVVRWICSFTGGAVHYHLCEEKQMVDLPGYSLGYIPEDYSLQKVQHTADTVAHVYKDEKGRTLKFIYTNGVHTSDLYFFNKKVVRSEVSFDDTKGDLYISTSPNECSRLVWSNSDENLMFVISYQGDQEELFSLAQGVEKK